MLKLTEAVKILQGTPDVGHMDFEEVEEGTFKAVFRVPSKLRPVYLGCKLTAVGRY